MTNDEGTNVSGEDVNASTQEGLVRLSTSLLYTCSWSPRTPIHSKTPSLLKKQRVVMTRMKLHRQKRMLQSEDEALHPTNAGDAPG